MQTPPLKKTILVCCLSSVLAAAVMVVPSSALALGFVISEIFFEAVKKEDGKQWLELYNGTGAAINLDDYSLGWGRDDYTHGTVDLPNEMLVAGDTYLIGGDGTPGIWDFAHNFDKDLRKGNKNTTDGVALFYQIDAADIDANSVPFFSVIYGKASANTVLLNELGVVGTPEVTWAAKFVEGQSIGISGLGTWTVATSPTPDSFTNPEPGTGVLLGLGLAGFAMRRQRRRLCA